MRLAGAFPAVLLAGIFSPNAIRDMFICPERCHDTSQTAFHAHLDFEVVGLVAND